MRPGVGRFHPIPTPQFRWNMIASCLFKATAISWKLSMPPPAICYGTIQRRLPEDTRPSVKKSIAVYGNNIYAATSDTHLIALDMKSGRLVWDTELADRKTGMQLTGGPIAAKGKVIIGTGGQQPGGNFIIALDAGSGKEAWR